MEAIFVQDGHSVDYTPDRAVSAGEVIVIGTIPMVATRDIAAGEQGALRRDGVFDVLKGSETYTAGDAVYWDEDGTPIGGSATGCATATASLGNLMGFAQDDAATGDTTVRVVFTSAKRTATIAGSVEANDITGSDSSLGIAGQAATTTTGAGGAIALAGGAGGSVSGAGGAVSLAGGAGTAGNANGGAISVLGGNAHGSGTDGVANLGTSNTSAVNIAAASIPTSIIGPLNRAAGDSTAAAGSTYEDAGALPAGTAGVYPTTAADDTKGVIVNAADKVTGRMIFIGNGVSDKILKVYGPEGATINGGSANAAFSSVSGKGVVMYCLSSDNNTWLAW